MEILISVSKAIGVTLLIMSPIICIFVAWYKWEKECNEWEQESRKLFGGDLYEPKDNKE